MSFVLIFIGGGLGSLCRYALAVWLSEWDYYFPTGTFTANLVSCLFLGFLLGLQLKNPMPDLYRVFLFTGFCGGFSTFSTFSSETFFLLEEGQYYQAMGYVALSLITGIGSIFLGIRMA